MSKKKGTRHARRFLAHLKPVKGRLFLAGLCTIGVSAAGLLKPWPLKIIVDHVILDKPLPESLSFLGGFAVQGSLTLLVAASCSILLIAVGEALFSYFQIFISSSVGYRVVYAIRRDIFAHLQRLSLSFHNRSRTGDLMSRIAVDTNDLRNIFSEDILQLCSQIMMVIGMFVILFLLDWRVALIAFATLPFLTFSLFYLYRKSRATSKQQKKQEARVASRMTEVLTSIPLVQAYGGERHEQAKFDSVTAMTLRESIRIARLKAATKRSSEIITEVGTAAGVLFAALRVIRGEMMVGELTVIVSYLHNMYRPLKGMAKITNDVSKAVASADRVAEVLDIEPEIQDRPDAIEANRLKGDIAFQGVSFDYGDGRDVLRDVSFTVSPGQRLALVGASGAGKSTIASLILRLYEPREGAILIDGVDIRGYSRDSLRGQIALVLQQALLFGATVRENIAYGRSNASDEEIIAAAEAANAHEFIRELENGYDTVIGERGATLSGGQRQRIALARAIIRNAPILILDEPMTGLDVESEAKVREALDRLMAGKTVIIITHDLAAAADADLVLVLEEGRVSERGTHDDLLAISRRYRQLCELDGQAAVSAPNRDASPALPRTAQGVLEHDRHFPTDPAFPQLEIAGDPARMLEVFRAHLKPVEGKDYRIEDCTPVRFRCRPSTSRCVLQYTLRIVEPSTDRRWDQWVTGLVYTRADEAERLWRELLATHPRRQIPAAWLTFEPVEYIPDLRMLVVVFPYDRRLPHLGPLMNGAGGNLEPLMLARLGPGEWSAEARKIEPARYRTELGAALRFTLRAREAGSADVRTVRSYLKVYRNDHGAQTYELLRALAARPANGRAYSTIAPLAYFADLHTLVLDEAPGHSLQQILLHGGDPAPAMRAVARAAASFNQDTIPVTAVQPVAEQLAEVEEAAEIVAWACPALAAEARALAATVIGNLDMPFPMPIHRDLKTDHVFLAGDRVTFIDLDSVILGDPVRDPAHLYAHLVARVGLDGLTRDAARASAAAFVEEYFAHVPGDWRRRFPVHCAGALLEVARGIFKRQEPRWPEKVSVAIEEARRALDGSDLQ
jgi:ATP-binding cassette, subfamily B, bacterial